jgi:uncharacterized protein (TIGR02301 family)
MSPSGNEFAFEPGRRLSYVHCMKTVLVLFVSLILGTVLAQAQQATTNPSTVVPGPTTPHSGLQEPVAPYDDKLLRLSEILGAVHYIRTLCGAEEGNKWRDVMNAILQAETPGPRRKSQLIAHFNRGYRTFSGSYRACTPSAALASERYLEEGAALSSRIADRYGR